MTIHKYFWYAALVVHGSKVEDLELVMYKAEDTAYRRVPGVRTLSRSKHVKFGFFKNQFVSMIQDNMIRKY